MMLNSNRASGKCTSVFTLPKTNPLQYTCMENPMDRGALKSTILEVARVGHDLMTKANKT